MFTTIDKIQAEDVIHVRNDVLTIKVNSVEFEKTWTYGDSVFYIYRIKGMLCRPYFDDEKNVKFKEEEINTTLDTTVILLLLSRG